MKRLILLTLCLIIFGVAACQGAGSDSAAAVVTGNEATATAVPTTVVSTNTPLPSATLTNTSTQTPTATPRPTETATATPTLTPSLIPSPTISLWQSDLVERNADFKIVDQLGGRINTVTVQDGIAYVGVGPRLWTLDVSRPETPIELGESDILPELIQYIAVFGDTAYVLTIDESGFWIIDVSQPHNPQIRTFFETSEPIYFLQIWNKRLYVSPTSREHGALIFDLEDSFQPLFLSQLLSYV